MAAAEGAWPERMVADGRPSMPGPTAVPTMRLTAAQKLFFSPVPAEVASARTGSCAPSLLLLRRQRHCRLGDGNGSGGGDGEGGGFADASVRGRGELRWRKRGEGNSMAGDEEGVNLRWWRPLQSNMAEICEDQSKAIMSVDITRRSNVCVIKS